MEYKKLNEREDGIEKFILTIAACYHNKACRVVAKGDRKGRGFLSHPQTNNRFLFLLTIKYRIFIFKEGLPEVPAYVEMRHDITLT